MTALDRRPALELISDDGALAALRDEWDELLRDAEGASVFMAHAWVASWRATLGAGEDLRMIAARHPDDGRLLGVAPFVVGTVKVGPISLRVLRMAGSGAAASDHLDIIVRHGHPHVAAELAGAARGGDWDLIDLDGLRPGSALAGRLLRRRGDRETYLTTTACPVLHLPESWEEYEASLGKSHRQNLRRYARKLDREAGGPVVERMVADPEDLPGSIRDLAALHQGIRTARGDRGSFGDPRMLEFVQTVAARFLKAGRLRLHRLDVGGKLAAGILCFRHDETVSFYTTGYDPAYSAYGPGRRIMAAAIRSAIDEGARRFDFLRGDEAYKRAWGAVDALDEHIRMPASVKGRVVTRATGAARAVKRTTRGIRR